MPEYLAPGVYIEETSFRSKSIEGVGTSTTGFVGATRYGPTDGEPELITSFSQFERIYGGLDPLTYNNEDLTNYLAHAVRAFFDNGGSRLYVARAFSNRAAGADPNTPAPVNQASAAIPSPVSQIDSAQAAASAAANQTLANLDTALDTLLQIEAQLSVLQTSADAQAADPDWQAVSTNADTQLDAIDTERARIRLADNSNPEGPVRTQVSSAYNNGVTSGNSDVLGSADIPALTAAEVSAQNAADSVTTATDALAAALNSLATNVAAASNPTEAQAAITEAGNLITNIVSITDSAATTATAITTAARLAQVEQRLAITNATAQWQARFPGQAGNMSIVVSARIGENVLTQDISNNPKVNQLRSGSLVLLQQGTTTIHSALRENNSWIFRSTSGSDVLLSSLNPGNDAVYPLELSVDILQPGKFSQPRVWENLTLSDLSARSRDSLTTLFAQNIPNRLQQLETPVILTFADGTNPAQLADSLLNQSDWAGLISASVRSHSQQYQLTGGTDGFLPQPPAYEGFGDDSSPTKSGLKSLADLEEISIIAAPGYSQNWDSRQADILTISQHLITHCEQLVYRVAVLDSPNDQSLSGVRGYRALLDTTRAALYYPWVTVLDPISDLQINLPPSGFVAGIYARNDVEIGVHKAPANEVARGVIGLESTINKAQQDVLNPLGINCIRFFEGRGIRVWGARTLSSDPEWKYLNVRRYFAYLEASIDRSTQWAVFQPNGDQLWDNIRRTVEGFLENEWREGRLAGAKLEDAFFVRCDRSTMTQNDLDNGRLICLIGVAPLYPAEFVIFRIGQWTADRR